MNAGRRKSKKLKPGKLKRNGKKAEAQKQLDEQRKKVQKVSQPAAQLYEQGKKYHVLRIEMRLSSTVTGNL
ncbi:MAG: hypothetical protein IJR63_03730 [Synergistaceae bacterium]|nr:hypothetical protein [Synergistaceae bacterium]